MSGIYIPGMEMPTNCNDCPMANVLCCALMPGVPSMWAEYSAAIRENRLHSDCPLVPVPDHGRLGDLDELLFNLPAPIENEYKHARNIVSGAPTIIPADNNRCDPCQPTMPECEGCEWADKEGDG